MPGLGPASTKPLLTDRALPYANEAHDDWLAALVERGVLGLFALLLLAGCVRPGRPGAAAAAVGADGRRRAGPGGLVAALLALGVNSFYEEILHFRSLWLLFGIVAVLGKDARPAR